MVVAEISAFPIGEGESLSASVAAAVKVIKESGLKYQLGPMGTTVEGEWDDIMDLVTKCRNVLVESNNRVYMVLKIDERKDLKHGMAHKTGSVENKL
ncbi:MTH1187 family thiamine-binding protein [Chloroflexota bacterium]